MERNFRKDSGPQGGLGFGFRFRPWLLGLDTSLARKSLFSGAALPVKRLGFLEITAIRVVQYSPGEGFYRPHDLHLGVSEIRGCLLEVLTLRESYYLGVHFRVPLFS